MAVYYSLLIIILLSGLMTRFKKNGIVFFSLEGNNKKYYCITIAFILIFLIGLRSIWVGSDTVSYNWKFGQGSSETIKGLISDFLRGGFLHLLSEKNTSFFYIIFLSLKSVGFSFNACILLFAIAFVSPIVYLFYVDSNCVWKSCFWFIILLLGIGLSGVRISLAIGITALSYSFYKGKKKYISVLFMIVAIMIHISAIVFVAFFIVDRARFSRKTLQLAIPIFLITPFIGKFLFPLILRFTYHANATNIPWSLPVFLLYSVSTILMIFYSPDSDYDYIVMMIIGTIICGIANGGALSSLYLYYTQFFCIALPNMIGNIRTKSTRLCLEAFYFAIGIYLFFRTFSSTSSFVPYAFFWQN